MKKLAVLLVLMMTVLGVNRAAAWNFWTCDGFDKSSLSLFDDTKDVWSDLPKSVSGTGPVVWKFTLKPTTTTLPWKWHYQGNTWRAQGLTIDCSDDKLNAWEDLNDTKNEGQNQFTNLTVGTEYVITMQAKSEAENWIMKVKVEKASFTGGDLTYTVSVSVPEAWNTFITYNGYSVLSGEEWLTPANGKIHVAEGKVPTKFRLEECNLKDGFNTNYITLPGEGDLTLTDGVYTGSVAACNVDTYTLVVNNYADAPAAPKVEFTTAPFKAPAPVIEGSKYTYTLYTNKATAEGIKATVNDSEYLTLKANTPQTLTIEAPKPAEPDPVDPNRYVVRLCGENMNMFPGGFDDNGVGTNNIMTTTDGITYTYTVDVTSGTHTNQWGFGLRVHDNTVDKSSMWLSSEAPVFKPGTPVTVKTGIAHNIAFAPTFTENTRLLFTYTRTGGADDVTGTLKVECTSLASTPVVYSPAANYDGFNFDNVTISVVGSDNQTRTYAVDGTAKTSLTAADIKSATLSGVVLPEQFAACADNFDWTLDVTESNGALNFALAAQQARQAYFAFHDGSGFGAPATVKVKPVHGQEFSAVACTKPAPRSAARRAAAADSDGNYWYAVATNKSIPVPVAEGENAVADTKVAITFEQATVTFVPSDAAKNNGFAEQTATLPAALPANQVVTEVTQSAAHTWPTLYLCGGINEWKIDSPVEYNSTDGIYYIDNLRSFKNGQGGITSFGSKISTAKGSWDIFNKSLLGISSTNIVLEVDKTYDYKVGLYGDIIVPDRSTAADGKDLKYTLEIDMTKGTMVLHLGRYRRTAKGAVVTIKQDENMHLVVESVDIPVRDACQAIHNWQNAFPTLLKDVVKQFNIDIKQGANKVASLVYKYGGEPASTPATIAPGEYTVVVSTIALDQYYNPNVYNVVNANEGAPSYLNTSFPLTVTAPGSKSQFAKGAVLAAQPVTLNGSVEMPAGIPGHSAPVCIDKANQYTYTFKPGMALADATNVSYKYTVNGVEVQPVSTNTEGYVTIGMLPFDASARSSAPLLLGITATYTLGGNEYTGATEYHAIARAPMSANAISMTPGQTKIYSTGGFYNASYYNVYTLAQPYTFEATNHAYFVGGVKVSTGDDFYTSTPPNWFDDFVYGTVGRNFDRTPRLYPETWATDMWQGSEIEVVFPHIMHVVKGNTADVKHGAANVEFVAYYPVVYNAALLGGSSSAARAAGDNQTVATLKQTYVATGNPITAATYASDNVMTGIANIDTDDNGAAEYYNLQGVRIANPTPGIYLMRQGGKVSKVVLQ